MPVNGAQNERQRLKRKATEAGQTLHSWRKDNQGTYYVLHCLIVHNRKKAKRRGIDFTLKLSDLRAIYEQQQGTCPLKWPTLARWVRIELSQCVVRPHQPV